MDYTELMEKAKEASKNSYSPYSNFPVGACVLGKSGRTYVGTNFENASYGLTICSERNAIGNAIVNGEREILAIAIYGQKMKNCTPCGACRQVIYEFKGEQGIDVILENEDGSLNIIKIDDLLPVGFNL